MKLTVDRDTLRGCLEILSKVVRPAGRLPARVDLVATDSKLELDARDPGCLQASMTLAGEVARPGGRSLSLTRLLAVVRSCEGEMIQIDASRAASLVLTDVGHARRFQLGTGPIGAPGDGLEELKETVGSASLHREDLVRMLRTISYCVAKDAHRGSLHHASFELEADLVRMAATDGHRLAVCTSPAVTTRLGASRVDALIPRALTESLVKIAPSAGVWSFRWSRSPGNNDPYVLRIEGGLLVVHCRATAQGDPFPDWREVVPKPWVPGEPASGAARGVLELDRRATLAALGRASVIVGHRLRGCVFLVDPSGLVELVASGVPEWVSGGTTDDFTGFAETLPAETRGELVTFSLQPRYLIDVLKRYRTERFQVEVSHALAPLRITEVGGDGRPLSILMPMRMDDVVLRVK